MQNGPAMGLPNILIDLQILGERGPIPGDIDKIVALILRHCQLKIEEWLSESCPVPAGRDVSLGPLREASSGTSEAG